jgi:hypothetical protein
MIPRRMDGADNAIIWTYEPKLISAAFSFFFVFFSFFV